MIIYKITNLVNGKVYIGQTTQKLSRRWREHCHALTRTDGKVCPALCNAMKKYGPARFTIERIESCQTANDLNVQEVFWIAEYDSRNKNKGYNIALGGGHLPPAPETIAKIVQAIQKSRVSVDVLTLEVKKYVSAESTASEGFDPTCISRVCKGHSLSHGGRVWFFESDYNQLTAIQLQERVRKAKSNKVRRFSSETLAKLSAVRMGHPTSPETREKISKSLMGHFVSEDTKARQRKPHRTYNRQSRVE